MTTGAPAATGVILAGGDSRRMGRDKATLRLGGQTLLERTIHVLAGVTDEVLVVGRSQQPASFPDVRMVPDDLPGTGPLGGLLCGLKHASHTRVVVVACDLPFLDPALLRYLLAVAPGYQAVIPLVDGRPQPLHAVYARETRSAIEQQLRMADRRVESLLPRVQVRWVDEAEIDQIDHGRRSFVNVNTREEWECVLRFAGEGP